MISLTFQSITDMTIKNQCSNIKLTSPVYFIKDVTCHIQFPQQVNTKSIMRANFMAGVNRDTFGGILLYHLQRKEGASTGAQLLVIWGYRDDIHYLDVHIIEYEGTLDCDKLKKLYNVYNCHDIWLDKKWLLNDDKLLETRSRMSYGDFEIRVIISEIEYMFSHRRPLRIDPNNYQLI
jgi:hypothetical protein